VRYLRGFTQQAEVVFAVAMRETRTRFGASQLGYLWAMIEPTLVILTFYIVFQIAHRAVPPGMDLFSFIATGVVPYTLFSSSVVRVSEAINANKALLYYPQVQPLDLVLARAVLEAATFVAVFLVLMGGHALFTQHLELESPLVVIAGFAMASMLGTGLGLILCSLGEYSTAVDRARGPLLRPLFWISGIFFTAETLSPQARHALLYNPILHATELVRSGWFHSYDAHHVDMGYVVAWIGGLLLLGLLLERRVRRRIEMT